MSAGARARRAVAECRLIDLHAPGAAGDDPAARSARSVLSERERRRADGFRDPAAAVTYIRARAAVRRTLAGVLGGTAAGVELAAEPGGRPVLPEHPGWYVSWSRSAGVLLVAVRYGGPVGVDVELVRPLGSGARVLGTVYPGAAALGELDDPEAFFSAWTLLEAAVKASGRGLARGGREVRLVRPPGSARCALGGIRGTGGAVWRGRTDRLAVTAAGRGPRATGPNARVMTAVVTRGPSAPPVPLPLPLPLALGVDR
ncbi:4'-phosphopantetheinyl transferase family protein [Streptomyces qinzhouensis]|uniref:Phosphopantetheinyl transferase-like protein n=1 Tax=Streptomyces qinzhouensis TaxID=2599401 RepID=A0A5B8J6U3_9ACTN|nr:phosphopantetheinyl transferase-like protein [Streptomyces qinzhouensis]QDY77057.1 phosphopantetheinyl transferase-like protein [Streptomyces qinzhouensis]